ncbi:uncharacterized protein [Dendrobates tinctorius]|uniref:uncharacterized protein isoform X3 n=1 Tax=Dendrobates tinctorius TaxID=92724 RepID=UPI003CCA2229
MKTMLRSLRWTTPALCFLLACAVVCQLTTTITPSTSSDANCTTVNTSACGACAPGTHSNNGQFASAQNASRCEPCPEDTFCNTSSCTHCTMCPEGQESLEVGSVECTLCLPGMYKGLGDDRCKYCRDGEYQVNSGGVRCEECPKDHYCPSPDISPISCPEDAFCPRGSSEPSYCMETFLRKDGESCRLAPLTIAILVVCIVVILLGVLYIIRKQMPERRRVMGLSPKSPLLHPKRSSSIYGITYDAEPVYAGW